VPTPSKPLRLFVASSNQGKLREYCALAAGASIEIELFPGFDAIPPYEEGFSTFAENALGKALHYSSSCSELVIADDSGLVVPALGGAPGVHSARYAGPGASDADRVRKLLAEMRGLTGEHRAAYFVCIVVVAKAGNVLGLFSTSAEGEILEAPRGEHGFGYDPVFFFPAMGKSYAELSREEKNLQSHRGKAFRKALDYLLAPMQDRQA
jgi:XTP/dITP diphosphohydrolase